MRHRDQEGGSVQVQTTKPVRGGSWYENGRWCRNCKTRHRRGKVGVAKTTELAKRSSHTEEKSANAAVLVIRKCSDAIADNSRRYFSSRKECAGLSFFLFSLWRSCGRAFIKRPERLREPKTRRNSHRDFIPRDTEDCEKQVLSNSYKRYREKETFTAIEFIVDKN